MPTATISKRYKEEDHFWTDNPLPSILHTPSGIALVEIQGTINIGDKPLTTGTVRDVNGNNNDDDDDDDHGSEAFDPHEIRQLGNFDFSNFESGEVVLDIAGHQRLRGKVVKLKTPLAVVKLAGNGDKMQTTANDPQAHVEMPVLEIITQKLVFSARPEPLI